MRIAFQGSIYTPHGFLLVDSDSISGASRFRIAWPCTNKGGYSGIQEDGGSSWCANGKHLGLAYHIGPFRSLVIGTAASEMSRSLGCLSSLAWVEYDL